MIVFWIVAAVLTALAVAMVLRPLLRPRAAETGAAAYARRVYADQVAEIERDLDRGVLTAAEAKAARAEVGRRLLATEREDKAPAPAAPPVSAAPAASPRAATALMLLLPAAALLFYLPLGRPDLPAQPLAARQDVPQVPEEVQAAAASLARKLEQNPDDLQGWALLASTYAAMGRHQESADAFRRASALSQGDPELTGSFAEQLTMAGGGIVSPDARRVFEAVIATDPGNFRARYYLAVARQQAGDVKGAIDGWASMLADSPADAPWVEHLRRRIYDSAVLIGIDPVRATPQPRPPIMAQAPQAPAEGQGGAQPGAPALTPEQMQAVQQMSPEDRQLMIRGMVDGLAQKLEANPGDVDGWLRLARARQVLGEADAAADALRRALAALPADSPRRAGIEEQLKALGG